jgi:predicted HicB family RNase H-like nuclease
VLNLEPYKPKKNPSRSEQPRLITVRLSRELHTRLRDAAWREDVSLNSLCVAGLVEALRQLDEQTRVKDGW